MDGGDAVAVVRKLGRPGAGQSYGRAPKNPKYDATQGGKKSTCSLNGLGKIRSSASDLGFAVMRSRREVLTVVKELCVCVCIASCERAPICMGGWFGWEILYGRQKRERRRKTVWGEDQTALFTMGRLIEGLPVLAPASLFWHVPSLCHNKKMVQPPGLLHQKSGRLIGLYVIWEATATPTQQRKVQ